MGPKKRREERESGKKESSLSNDHSHLVFECSAAAPRRCPWAPRARPSGPCSPRPPRPPQEDAPLAAGGSGSRWAWPRPSPRRRCLPWVSCLEFRRRWRRRAVRRGNRRFCALAPRRKILLGRRQRCEEASWRASQARERRQRRFEGRRIRPIRTALTTRATLTARSRPTSSSTRTSTPGGEFLDW